MLKVLLFSHYFYPALGGIESVSLTLADGFVKNGIDCKVITKTPYDGETSFDFEVIRNPDRKQQKELVKWADVVLFNGASMALQPWVLMYRKPFIWVHQSYLVSCIDGLGWVEGVKAPLTPWASIKYHAALKGWIRALNQGVVLLVKRFFAKHLVTQNIAITEWVNQLQPLPGQKVIYNPFPINQFSQARGAKSEFDFLFLGRLVSEKGVATLLKAFARVVEKQGSRVKLLIIGDGNWKGKMADLAASLKITDNVTFAGKKSGPELVELVGKGKIAVVPSEWYEPMGGVALELMAAGKSLIVSEYGGLKECVGDAGLSFKNGDDNELAECMRRLLGDQALQEQLIEKAAERIKLFAPEIFVGQYAELLNDLARK